MHTLAQIPRLFEPADGGRSMGAKEYPMAGSAKSGA
jgi:hypothetical protein